MLVGDSAGSSRAVRRGNCRHAPQTALKSRLFQGKLQFNHTLPLPARREGRRAPTLHSLSMKLHADRAEGVNVIHACEPGSVSINGVTYRHSVMVPYTGEVAAWAPVALADLTEDHFTSLAAAQPEVIVFGSGATLRFPPPAVLRALMQARIGVESMDTAAACRTFNILAGEGRRVWAALLV